MEQTTHSFLIKKIEEKTDCWIIYPYKSSGVSLSTITILKQYYNGSLPSISGLKYYKGQLPFISGFLRQLSRPNKLDVTLLGDFVISATMNGTHLFTLTEEQYPDKLKKELAIKRAYNERILAEERAYIERISSLLNDYLEKISAKPPSELRLSMLINDLPPVLKPYINQHNLYDSTATEERLYISSILSGICADIYHQEIPKDPKEYLCSDKHWFCLAARYEGLYAGLASDLKHIFDLEEHNKELSDDLKETFFVKTCQRIKIRLQKRLPIDPPDELMKYFIICCAEILQAYAQDYSAITDTDECHIDEKNLELTKYTNLILPHSILR